MEKKTFNSAFAQLSHTIIPLAYLAQWLTNSSSQCTNHFLHHATPDVGCCSFSIGTLPMLTCCLPALLRLPVYFQGFSSNVEL